MISINIPGFAEVTLEHVIFDYNGTLAVDGLLIEGLAEKLTELSKKLKIHVVTGDSLGTAKKELQGIPCDVLIVPPAEQGLAKKNFIHTLNPSKTVSIGNGRNDQQLMKESIIGIITLGGEGTSIEALSAADVVVATIFDAFDLLEHPNRLLSTLRS
jgi:soluble P-type ATPase